MKGQRGEAASPNRKSPIGWGHRYEAERRNMWGWLTLLCCNVLAVGLALCFDVEWLVSPALGMCFLSLLLFARSWRLSERYFEERVREIQRSTIDREALLKQLK